MNELIEDKITLKKIFPQFQLILFFEELLVEMELWTIFVGSVVDL